MPKYPAMTTRITDRRRPILELARARAKRQHLKNAAVIFDALDRATRDEPATLHCPACQATTNRAGTDFDRLPCPSCKAESTRADWLKGGVYVP